MSVQSIIDGGILDGQEMHVVELDRGYGEDGQIMTAEESTSWIMLDDDLESDPIANALVEASVLGVEFGSEFRHIKTRTGVASILIHRLEEYGMDDVASFWHNNLFGKAA